MQILYNNNMWNIGSKNVQISEIFVTICVITPHLL